MADVRVTIAGRQYDVHCADGQEARLHELAALVDGKARDIAGGTEVRQLLFAALMLADEAQERKVQLDQAEPQLDSARAAVALAESRVAELTQQLAALAVREKAAVDHAHAATAREQDALDRLNKAVQANGSAETGADSPRSTSAAMDRALLGIADRIEALAARVEQGA